MDWRDILYSTLEIKKKKGILRKVVTAATQKGLWKSPQGTEHSWHCGFGIFCFFFLCLNGFNFSHILVPWALKAVYFILFFKFNFQILISRFSGMGCFLWLHLTFFWLFFSVEVGMLMYPAPHYQPPVWACLERLFFLVHLSFSLPSLFSIPRAVCCVYVCPAWWQAGFHWQRRFTFWPLSPEHYYQWKASTLQNNG